MANYLPQRDNKIRREGNIRDTVEEVTKKSQRKHNKSSSSKNKSSRSSSKGKQKETANGEEGRAPVLSGLLRHHSSDASSSKSDRSQLVE